MILIDDNNRPTNTVYYLSAIAYYLLSLRHGHSGITPSHLYEMISNIVLKRKVNFTFFVMALDFLFLLDKIEIDRKGYLHVH